jgi:hypothetical protein
MARISMLARAGTPGPTVAHEMRQRNASDSAVLGALTSVYPPVGMMSWERSSGCASQRCVTHFRRV